MKGKLKLIILSMLALFLVACGSATPSPDGGGTGSEITPKPNPEETKPEEIKPEPDPIEADDSKVPGDWKSIACKIKSEVKKSQGDLENKNDSADYSDNWVSIQSEKKYCIMRR